MKSYMDAGKKAKESKGLKNSFYAGSFKPIKLYKIWDAIYQKTVKLGKIQSAEEETAREEKTDDAFESNQNQTGETTTEKTNEI